MRFCEFFPRVGGDFREFDFFQARGKDAQDPVVTREIEEQSPVQFPPAKKRTWAAE